MIERDITKLTSDRFYSKSQQSTCQDVFERSSAFFLGYIGVRLYHSVPEQGSLSQRMLLCDPQLVTWSLCSFVFAHNRSKSLSPLPAL